MNRIEGQVDAEAAFSSGTSDERFYQSLSRGLVSQRKDIKDLREKILFPTIDDAARAKSIRLKERLVESIEKTLDRL